jgi:hypothetical protein
MKLSRRMVIGFLFIALLLLAGILFWPFILNGIIEPAALVVWVLLRLFVLSIDQRVYWTVIILLPLVFLFRILSPGLAVPSAEGSLGSNETINTIDYWRSRFRLNDATEIDEKALKRELTHLLASHYASKSHTEASFEIFDALQRGEIPLPVHIHTFLFPEKELEAGHPIKRLLRSIQRAPRKWIRRWIGEEKAEQYRMIEAVLDFMETSLEIKDEQ